MPILRLVIVTIATVVLLGAGQKKEIKPVALYVYDVVTEAEKDKPEEKWPVEARKELLKKIEKRKKQYKLVESPLDADVHLEITKAELVEDFAMGWNSENAPRSNPNDDRTTRQYVGSRDIKTFVIECRYMFPDQFQGLVEVGDKTWGRAADEILRRLSPLCKTYVNP